MRDAGTIRNAPLAGDVIEIKEFIDESPLELSDIMLRVVAVAEERVWVKQYGFKGHHLVTLRQWTERLNKAVNGGNVIVIQSGVEAR